MAAVGVLTVFIFALAMYCVEAQPEPRCFLPMMEGNCSESVQRWFYYNKTGLCHSFIYRGCGGNDNNFNSTMYCFLACNVSTEGAMMYSAEDRARMARERQQAGSAPEDDSVTPATIFGNRPGQLAAGINPTREPALIQNRTSTGGQRQRQPRPAGDSSSPRASPRYRRSVDEQQNKKQNAVDEADEESGGGRSGDTGLLVELATQMKSTAAKLEELIATVGHRSSKRRRRPHVEETPTNATESATVVEHADKTETTPNDVDKNEKETEGHVAAHPRRRKTAAEKKNHHHHQQQQRGRRAEKTSKSGRRGGPAPHKKQQHTNVDKLLEITLIAEKSRHDEKKSTPSKNNEKPEVVTAATAAAADHHDEDDGVDDEIEVVSDSIRSIIFDPSYVFSYKNITSEDMISLQEIVAQSEVGTMKLVEKGSEEAKRELADDVDDDDDDAKEAVVEPTTMVAPAAQPSAGGEATSAVAAETKTQATDVQAGETQPKQDDSTKSADV